VEPTLTVTITCTDSTDFAGHLSDNLAAVIGAVGGIDWSTVAPNLTGVRLGFTVEHPAESVPL
jgi:hypothetical protein